MNPVSRLGPSLVTLFSIFQNCTHREQRVDVLMSIVVQLVAPSVWSTHLLVLG